MRPRAVQRAASFLLPSSPNSGLRSVHSSVSATCLGENRGTRILEDHVASESRRWPWAGSSLRSVRLPARLTRHSCGCWSSCSMIVRAAATNSATFPSHSSECTCCCLATPTGGGMATERLSMRKTRKILRQKLELNRSHREVAASVGGSQSARWARRGGPLSAPATGWRSPR